MGYRQVAFIERWSWSLETGFAYVCMYLDVVDDALADSDNLPDLGLVKHQEQCGHSLENAWGRVREDRE